MRPPDIDLIAGQLGKATRIRKGWLCLCPAHNDHNPSLSLSLSEKGKLLACCYAGCSFADVLAALHRRGVLEKAPPLPQTPSNRVLRIWREAVPVEGTVVETYLKSRGISGPIPPTLKFHPQLFHSSGAHPPAMISAVAVWPHKTLTGVHRTYLAADGSDKAALSPNKMMLGPIKGGAVRLAPAGPTLILAEGIETALSCFYATNIPTWSCLSTSGMVNVVLPSLDITQEIIICADGDVPGEKAAQKLSERLVKEGYTVRTSMPPQGQDFNDVLKGEA